MEDFNYYHIPKIGFCSVLTIPYSSRPHIFKNYLVKYIYSINVLINKITERFRFYITVLNREVKKSY